MEIARCFTKRAVVQTENTNAKIGRRSNEFGWGRVFAHVCIYVLEDDDEMTDLQELRRLATEVAEYKNLSDVTPDNASLRHAYHKRSQNLVDLLWAKPETIIAILDRLEAAEKVCEYVYQNTGMHCSAIGKCTICNKMSTQALGMVCDRCITEAVLEWQKVKEGQ